MAQRGHDIFVEAGTYRGDTVEALRHHACQVVSVELDERLFATAQKRFKDIPDVRLHAGDATELIPEIVNTAPPALIFLDGHYSGPGTALGAAVEPATEILHRLAGSAPPGTTIVVDDLRLFGTDSDYPELDALTAAARRAFPAARQRIGLDSLVIEI